MSVALRRPLGVALLALSAALSGCGGSCPAPRTSLVARPIERTLYGTGLLVVEHGEALAEVLAPFERRALKVDASRPVAVVAMSSAGWGEVARLDGGNLQPGDRGAGFVVLGVTEGEGKVPLFDGAEGLAEAARGRWDALALVPRTPGKAPWQAAITVEMGRTVRSVKDKETGACVEQAATSGQPPTFRLASLPVRCGDGIRQDDEDCDDGNRVGGDGCSPFCTKER